MKYIKLFEDHTNEKFLGLYFNSRNDNKDINNLVVKLLDYIRLFLKNGIIKPTWISNFTNSLDLDADDINLRIDDILKKNRYFIHLELDKNSFKNYLRRLNNDDNDNGRPEIDPFGEEDWEEIDVVGDNKLRILGYYDNNIKVMKAVRRLSKELKMGKKRAERNIANDVLNNANDLFED